MLNTDQELWERELAEHMKLYGTDLLRTRRFAALAKPGSQRHRRLLTVLFLWIPVAVVGSVIGWSVGWYLI
jgi:hypothetical protein